MIDNSQQIENFLRKVRNDRHILERLNCTDKTYPFWLAAIERDCTNIDFVTEDMEFLYPGLCLAAVAANPGMLLSMWNQTYDCCMTAVANWNYTLKYVDADSLSVDEYNRICRMAVERDHEAIKYVDNDKFGGEFTDKFGGKFNEYIKQAKMLVYHDYDFAKFMRMIEEDGFNIVFVDRDAISEDDYLKLCFKAVEKDGKALRCVPEDLRSRRLCELALEPKHPFFMYLGSIEYCDSSALKYVPGNFLDREMIRHAFLAYDFTISNNHAIRYIPEEMLTKDIVMRSVRDVGSNIQYVPEHMRTEEVNMAAVGKSGTAIRFIKDPSQQVRDQAVKNCPQAMGFWEGMCESPYRPML